MSYWCRISPWLLAAPMARILITPQVFRGSGAVCRLTQSIKGDRVALVYGVRSFLNSAIRPLIIEGVRRLEVREFAGWHQCPTSASVAALGHSLAQFSPQTIIAVGGGSVMDVAKSA